MKTTAAKPEADFTYDQETDQFVVRLDDGTEVCRTSAPHTAIDRELAQEITDALNDGEIRQLWPQGGWDLSLAPAWLRMDVLSHRVTFYPDHN